MSCTPPLSPQNNDAKKNAMHDIVIKPIGQQGHKYEIRIDGREVSGVGFLELDIDSMSIFDGVAHIHGEYEMNYDKLCSCYHLRIWQ